MTATANLPTTLLADSIIVNYQGNSRRMTIAAFIELIGGGGGGGSGSGLAAEVVDRQAADNWGDTLFLNVDAATATAQAMTATIPTAQAHISPSAGQRVQWRCAISNTGADPTIRFNNTTYTIKPRTGGTLAAADMVSGQRYGGYIYTSDPAIIRLGESVRISDINGLAAELADMVANGGKFYATRAAAMAAGQSVLIGALSRIVTIEDEHVVWRAPFQNGDDPLFGPPPYWGVIARTPKKTYVDALLAAANAARVRGVSRAGVIPVTVVSSTVVGTETLIVAEIDGTLWADGVGIVSGSMIELIPPSMPTTPITRLRIENEGSSPATRSIMSERNNVAAAPEHLTGGRGLMLKLRGGNWVISNGASNERVDIARQDRIIADAQTGTVPLTSIGGTADVITASVPTELVATGVVASLLRRIRFQLAVTNTGAVSINIDGQGPVSLRDSAGAVLTAGYIMPGRAYEAVKDGALWKVVAGEVARTEMLAIGQRVDAESQARTAAFTRLSAGNVLADGSLRLVYLEDAAGRRVADVLRLSPNGLIGLLDPVTADQALEKGSVVPGPVRVDRSRVTRSLNGKPLEVLYPDGLHDKRSQAFWEQIPDAYRGGGLTAEGWATASDGSFTVQSAHHGVHAVERVILRADGVKVAAPVVNSVQRRASINSSGGQSNANVTRLLDALMTSTAIFPFNTFMLDDMNAYGSGTHRGGMMGWQGVAVARGSRMIGASEELRATQDYSCIAFSTETRLSADMLRRVGLIRSSAWGGNKLRGDSVGTGIWRDSAGTYTQAWANWQGDLLQSYQLMSAQGYLVDQVNIHFSHQEADWQTLRATYLADFLLMKGEMEAWIAANLPGTDVQWFVDQASGSGRRTPTYNGGAWPSRLAIVDACRPENGGTNITMVLPRYWLPFGTTLGGNQEDIHHAYRARIWQGEVYGYARKEKRAGRAWRCPVMSSAGVSGNSIVVNFDSLLPLVIDWSFCQVRTHGGFTVGNGAVVNGIRQTGQRQITVDCATTPAGSINYAFRSVDAQDVLDEWPICTGAIRDAWEAPSLFDPGKKLPRAALGYQLTL